MESFERNSEDDLKVLIAHAIKVGQSLKGVEIPKGNGRIKFIEPLFKKTIDHIISAFFLYSGKGLILNDKIYSSVDFPSIAVLTRAAIETYLTFNYIFINPEDQDEEDFRFLCWDLAGIVERENYPVRNVHSKKVHSDEQVIKSRLVKELENNKIFKNLPSRGRRNIIEGNWRNKKGWATLAKEAKLLPNDFKHIYSHICSYAHSGRLSIIQIQQTNGFILEQKFSEIYLLLC